MMENVLDFKGVCKKYKGFQLKDVTFSIPKGYIMGLIGPNGAGKTTIIKLIMNLIRKDAGEIKVFGLDHLQHEAEVKARIGFVYDVPSFYQDAVLQDIKRAIAPFYQHWDEPLFQALISEFQLPPKLKFKKLSQGMQTKFALALALSHGADLILMDEPTTGLDPIFRRELLGKLAAIMQDERKSILFSTHITSDLEKTADYITFVRDGQIVFSSPKDEILEKWGVVKGGKELLDQSARKFFQGIRVREYGIEALTNRTGEVRRRFGEWAVVEKASLDDIMVLLAGGNNHVA